MTHKPDKIAVEGCDLRSEDKKKSSLCWGVYAGLTGWEIQKFSTQKKPCKNPHLEVDEFHDMLAVDLTIFPVHYSE